MARGMCREGRWYGGGIQAACKRRPTQYHIVASSCDSGGVAYRPHFDGLVDMIPAYLGHMHHVPEASTTAVACSPCVLALIL